MPGVSQKNTSKIESWVVGIGTLSWVVGIGTLSLRILPGSAAAALFRFLFSSRSESESEPELEPLSEPDSELSEPRDLDPGQQIVYLASAIFR